MNEENRRRRTVAAQGFAAAALLVFTHGARAATLPASAGHAAHPAVAAQVQPAR